MLGLKLNDAKLKIGYCLFSLLLWFQVLPYARAQEVQDDRRLIITAGDTSALSSNKPVAAYSEKDHIALLVWERESLDCSQSTAGASHLSSAPLNGSLTSHDPFSNPIHLCLPRKDLLAQLIIPDARTSASNINAHFVAKQGLPLMVGDSQKMKSNPTVVFAENALVGKVFLVAWQQVDSTDPLRHDIYGQLFFFDPSKKTLTASTAISLAALPHDERQPQLVYNSEKNEFLVVYEQDVCSSICQGQIIGRRLNMIGQPLQEEPFLVIEEKAYSAVSPKLAYGDGHTLVVWEEVSSVDQKSSVQGRWITRNGDLGNKVLIAQDQNVHQNPAIAFNSLAKNEFFVVWEERDVSSTESSNALHIAGAFVKAEEKEAQKGFRISSSASGATSLVHKTPHVAYYPKQDHYIVAWEQLDPNIACNGFNQNIYLSRIYRGQNRTSSASLVNYLEEFSAMTRVQNPYGMPAADSFIVFLEEKRKEMVGQDVVSYRFSF